MKYSFLVIFVVILSLTYAGGLCSEKKCRSFDEVLEEIANTSNLKNYHDSVYGYVATYPDFLEKQSNSLCEYPGDARFSFSNVIQIDMEVTVSRRSSMNISENIHSIARQLHAKVRETDQDSFILTGPQYDEGCRIDGCSQYCKYVAKGKLWFVYSLYYPDSYKKPIKRLFEIIDNWKPYKEYKPDRKSTRLNSS